VGALLYTPRPGFPGSFGSPLGVRGLVRGLAGGVTLASDPREVPGHGLEARFFTS
jgi:hypothetical protein